VVAGDAAFTCGISYEALNNVKAQTKRFIVVLNDNEWSIAKNVGAIAAYLNNIVTNPTYAHLHEKAGRFIKAIAGQGALHLAHKVEEGFKTSLSKCYFRGTRPALLRADRWSRHPAPHPDLRVLEEAGRTGAAPHPDEKGQRATSRPSPNRISFTALENSRRERARLRLPLLRLIRRFWARR
jgi:hypothetical protein